MMYTDVDVCDHCNGQCPLVPLKFGEFMDLLKIDLVSHLINLVIVTKLS